MGNKLHYTIRVIAYTLWFTALVAFGSIGGDADHVLPPYTRSWGHSDIVVLVVCLCGLAASYKSRLHKARILK